MMKPCNNPDCQAESYDPERDGEWSDYCPECHKTTCDSCGGWHEWDGECPFCRDKGIRDCIYDDAGPRCDGCPFQRGCELYEDYQEVIEREIHESRLVDQYRGK